MGGELGQVLVPFPDATRAYVQPLPGQAALKKTWEKGKSICFISIGLFFNIQEVPQTHLWLQLLSFVISSKTEENVIPFFQEKVSF